MAEIQELFPTTKDSNGAGVANDTCQDNTTAASGADGQIGFAFKSSAGNVILPQLTAAGAISVDTGAAGTPVDGTATATITTVGTEQTILTLTGLTLSKVHTLGMQMTGSFQPTLWIAYYVDDAAGAATATEIARWVTGPGSFQFCCDLSSCFQFDTTGGTGTQEYQIRATQLRGQATDVHVSACITEAP